MSPFIFTNSPIASAFWAAYILWFIFEMVGAARQRAKNRENVRIEDRGSMYILIGSLYVGLFLGFGLAWALPSLTMGWNPPLLVAVGTLLILLGIAFRWYAIRMLGRYFTRAVAVSQDQQVVQSGPYHYIRHPAYSGTLLTMLGIGLAMTNWASLLAVLLCYFVGHLYRVNIEEKALCETLGKPYVEYMQHTKRFIPFVY